MNTLHMLLSDPIFRTLGWTLVHSTWQGLLLALLLAVALAALRGAASRYRAGCAALALTLIIPLGTFLYLQPAELLGPTSVEPLPRTLIVVSPIVDDLTVSAQSSGWLTVLPWMALAWIVGVSAICVHHVGGWISLRSMRRRAIQIVSPAVTARFARLRRSLGIDRAVQLAESSLVEVPCVLGVWRPIVLLPCSALTGLSPLHLDALLAHELAHIRRHDYLANLLQTVIETLLFYHPAVWWISRQVRIERENCCDDIAANAIGSRRVYGQALTAMEELRPAPGVLAMAANGGSLLARIRRLASGQPQRSSMLWPALAACGMMLALAACSQTSTAQSTRPANETGATVADTPALPPPSHGVVDVPVPAAAPAAPPAIGELPPAAPAKPLPPEFKARQEVRALQEMKLEEQAAELARRAAEMQARFAEQHPAREQIRLQQAAIEDQLLKLRDGSLYELARSRPPAMEYYLSGVAKPGAYALQEDKPVTLAQALVAAGGGKGRHVVIVHRSARGGKTVEIFAISEAMQAGGAGATPIRPGDVMMLTDNPPDPLVADGTPLYSIEGEVPRPGRYALNSSVTLLQAVVAAGLNPLDAAGTTVELIHKDKPATTSYDAAALVGKDGNQELRENDKIVIRKGGTSRADPMGAGGASVPADSATR